MATEIEGLGDFSRFVGPAEDERVEELPRKRRRVEDSLEKFRPGNIIKVKVKNFTTYSYAEFNLSPVLNMIIGPNGSGKSTLVAAICLGLGGRIALIKRKTMKSMIKTGRERGEIEVVLKNKPGRDNITVHRSFSDRDSRWTINGRTGSEQDVRRICQKLNIQLDNLCHFLPQERVAEFAGLSPDKLLLETERTLGDGHLLNMHEELIKLDAESHAIEASIESTSTELKNLREERDHLELEAQRFLEYQEKSKELKLHQMLVPYAQLQDLKKQQKHLKDARNSAKRELDSFLSNTGALRNERQQLMSRLEDSNGYLQSRVVEAREIRNKQDRIQSELEEIKSKINDLVSTRDILKNRTAEKKKELEVLKAEIKALVNRRDSLAPTDEGKISQLRSEREASLRSTKKMKDAIARIRDDIDPKVLFAKRLSMKIESQRNLLTSKDKLNVLRPHERSNNRFREEVYLGHKLLRDQNEFSYFESPIITCDVPQSKYACYLEKVIDNNTLFAITLTSQEEYLRVSDFILKKYNIPIRLINSITKPRNIMDRGKLRTMGFDGFLSDFITGPPEVLSMLYNTARIDTIPVSYSGLSNQQIQNLTTPVSNDKLPFKRFISGDTLFNIHRSQYGSRQFFYSTERINPRVNFFGASGLSLEQKVDIERQVKAMEDQFDEVRQSINELSSEEKALIPELEKETEQSMILRREFEILERERARITTLDASIKAKGDHLKKLEMQAERDYTNRIREIDHKVSEKFDLRSKVMARKCQLFQEETDITIECNQEELKHLDMKNRATALDTLLRNLEEYKHSLEKAYADAKKKYDEIKTSDAARKIKRQSEAYSEEERNTLTNLARQYINDQCFTERFINERINLLEEERSLMSTADQNAVENLSQKIQTIKVLEDDHPRLIDQKNNIDSKISGVREQWEPELEDLIRQISLAFNKRFTKVASDGVVELSKSEHFKDWRLQILVKFRQESQLKVLDNQSQSGGERAVSTIFFIMSLQGLTDAPFRIVDEINQGMDQKNEKAAHKYFVHTACQTANSQYFLITPKLLTGLYYHPDMVVHCIFTGALVPPVDENSSKPDCLDFLKAIGT